MAERSRLKTALCSSLLCLICVYPLGVAAAEEEDELDEDLCPALPIAVQEEEEEPRELFGFLNAPHETVSSGLEWLSKRLDTFFANEKIYEEATGSYARLSASTILREGGKQNYLGTLRYRIELPKTKKKLRLMIESNTEEGIASRTTAPTQTTLEESRADTDTYAAIQTQPPKAEKKWKTRTSVGVKLRAPLDPFLRYRINRDINFSHWKLHFTETLFHFHASGSGHSTVLEWDRPIGKTHLFRSYSAATWWDDTDEYELGQSFTMFHEFTGRRALSYSVGVYGNNKPTIQAEHYLIDIRYRQRIHRDWLFYEINPQILYQKDRDFEPEHTLTLKLEMVFGKEDQ